jgi:pimeloyl-ACP methyl ester carboxylesterase
MRHLIGLILVAAVASAGLGDQVETRRAFRALFNKEDPPNSKDEIDRVLAACDNDAGKLKTAIAADDEYDEFKPLWLNQTTTFVDTGKTWQVNFVVRVPRGYTPRKSWPVLLAAHGQGGTGEHVGKMMENLLKPEVDKYIILAPTMPGPKAYSGQPYQEQAYLAPLSWLKRRLNVDDDRVYVSGYSQGGHQAWHLAVMYPHLFAAAVPMAGVPWFEGGGLAHDLYLENLSNLPLWAIWGEKDTSGKTDVWGNAEFSRSAAKRLKELDNKLFQGTELPGAGHGDCTPDPHEFRRFLADKKRNCVPTKVTRFFHLAHHGRGYYVEATALSVKPMELSKPIEAPIPAGQKPTTQNAFAAVKNFMAKALFKTWTDLDREHNAISIRGLRVKSVRLYVTEGMFDLSRPVTIRYWSSTWTGKIPASALCMATHYADDRDQTALVYNEIDLDIMGKMKIRYEGQRSEEPAPTK